MFEEYISDGANIFITIVAILVGFATAMGLIDFKGSSSKKENSHEE